MMSLRDDNLSAGTPFITDDTHRAVYADVPLATQPRCTGQSAIPALGVIPAARWAS